MIKVNERDKNISMLVEKYNFRVIQKKDIPDTAVDEEKEKEDDQVK